MSNIVPYDYNNLKVYPQSGQETLPVDITQGVHIVVQESSLDELLENIQAWFAERDDVSLISHGTTEKERYGYIIMEWDEYAIDRLFLDILKSEEAVLFFTVYSTDDEED